MIEVTQKNHKGSIQILARYKTEKEFGEAYYPNSIPALFSVVHKVIGHEMLYCTTFKMRYRVPIFARVVYNDTGKVMDIGHLVGIARKYNKRYNITGWWKIPGTKRNWHRGANMRQIHTTPERRASFSCNDQDDRVPNLRNKRNMSNLPTTWDDYWRHNEKNWKSFRKHQWK